MAALLNIGVVAAIVTLLEKMRSIRRGIERSLRAVCLLLRARAAIKFGLQAASTFYNT